MHAQSVISESVQSYGLQPARFLCPWEFPVKHTGVGYHFLLQGIFPTQRSNPGLLPCRQILCHLSQQGIPCIQLITYYDHMCVLKIKQIGTIPSPDPWEHFPYQCPGIPKEGQYCCNCPQSGGTCTSSRYIHNPDSSLFFPLSAACVELPMRPQVKLERKGSATGGGPRASGPLIHMACLCLQGLIKPDL